MGIRASYWATGGILTVLGLALARFLFPLLAGFVVAVGALLLKAVLVLVAALLAVLVIALARSAARRRRRRAAEG